MRIKSIEISGFKSFVDKVSLDFIPGITALVGPNGCGKSNIVDAFRWTMGEQSAKQLRGKMMEDVIFNGSETRKPLGMAEVSITFANENGNVPHHYSQYSEIMVTRRLFRSGDSEYSINKIPCRLKDITELFLDTGAGAKAYSIIEQGKVEQIINAKPQDRRLLLDEAAGISKYKSRKKEALSKIESTKNNLLRVDDIIVEVKRQLNSIKRQASKLKRYQHLKEEIKKIELNSSLLKYVSLNEKNNTLKTQIERQKEVEIGFATQISGSEAEYEIDKSELNEEERIYQQLQEEIYKASSQCQKEESRLEYLERELESAQNRYNQQLVQIKSINERMESHHQEITTLEGNNVSHNKKVADLASELIREEEQLSQLKEIRHESQDKIELQKNTLISLLAELTQINNRLSQIDQTRHVLTQKIDVNKTETENQTIALTAIGQQITSLKDDLKSTLETKSQMDEEKVTLLQETRSLSEQLHQTDTSLADVKEKWAHCNSRLFSLQELINKFEECEVGVRSIMLRDHDINTEANGVCGLLADIIETDSMYETALEAVLGEKLHYVIVESQNAGVEAIEFLKVQSLGRASLIPLQIRKHQFNHLFPSSESDKIKPLAHHVKTNDEYAPIIDYLLADVILVDTLHTALSLWNSNGINCTLVTLDGEIIDPAGIITGGHQNGAPSRILSKRREIKELEGQLSELTPTLDHLQITKNQLSSRLSHLKESSDKIQVQIHQKEITLLSCERDIRQSEKESGETQQRLELLRDDKEELLSTLKNHEDESIKLQQEREIKLSAQAGNESQLAILQVTDKDINSQIENLQNDITGLKVQVASEREKFENNIATLQRIKNNLVLLGEEHARVSQGNESEEQKQLTLKSDLQEAKSQIEKYQVISQELNHSIETRKESIIQKDQIVQEKEAVLKDIRRSLEEAKSKNNDLSIQITESNLTLTHLIQDIEEKYHLNLVNMLQSTSIEQIKDDENSYEVLDELRTKLESLGEVNLAAAQEQEELAERHTFLSEQREDLTKSIESLNQTIQKINRTTKQRFVDTYHKINEEFKKVFPALFQGGKAELKLTDENNILETGIEIVAQPTGKKLLNIEQLSGGEKTLTAIALLMAIFLVKPTPFCLMDEADAALDDANATLFNQYMKTVSHNAQFILITHNKLTMQVAKTLYGITMQEPGVSKVVSVQLQ